MTTRSDYQRLVDVWRAIGQAGGVQPYVQQQLRERGFVLERKPTDAMSKRELAAYKKSLKDEAAERKRLAKEAWQAYRATHIVHLGEGIPWSDDATEDKWDHARANERAAENELPAFDEPLALAAATKALSSLYSTRPSPLTSAAPESAERTSWEKTPAR